MTMDTSNIELVSYPSCDVETVEVVEGHWRFPWLIHELLGTRKPEFVEDMTIKYAGRTSFKPFMVRGWPLPVGAWHEGAVKFKVTGGYITVYRPFAIEDRDGVQTLSYDFFEMDDVHV